MTNNDGVEIVKREIDERLQSAEGEADVGDGGQAAPVGECGRDPGQQL